MKLPRSSRRDDRFRAHPMFADLFPGELASSAPVYWDGLTVSWHAPDGAPGVATVPVQRLQDGDPEEVARALWAPAARSLAGESYIVEHTSVNPVHAVHVAALRGSLVGNGLATLLREFGADVATHYFVNDLGRQVQYAAWITARTRWAAVPAGVAFDDAIGVLYAVANMLAAHREPDLGRMRRDHPWLHEALPWHELDTADLQGFVAGPPASAEAFVPQMLDHVRSDLAAINASIDVWEHESALEFDVAAWTAELARRVPVVTINGTVCLRRPDGLIPVARACGNSLYFLRDVVNLLSRNAKAHMIHVIGSEQLFLQRALADEAALYGRSVEHVSIGEVTIDGRRSSARQCRLLTVGQVSGQGPHALADLCLGLVSVRRQRQLRLPIARTVRSDSSVIRAAAERMTQRTGVVRYAAGPPAEALAALCLQAEGVVDHALRQRELGIASNVLLRLSAAYVAAADAGAVPAWAHHLTAKILPMLAGACGQAYAATDNLSAEDMLADELLTDSLLQKRTA